MVELLNNAGIWFCDYALNMLIQSSALIAILFIIDLIIRKRVRAVVRYCMWLLVLVKLVLPTSLSVPTGLGYWFGIEPTQSQKQTAQQVQSKPALTIAPTESIPAEPSPATKPAISLQNNEQPKPATLTTSPANLASVSEPVTAQGWLFLGWAIGVLVLGVLLLQRYWFVKSLIAQSTPATDETVLATLKAAHTAANCKQNIELRLTANMLSPAACGLSKPVVLMPAELVATLSEDKLRAVLLHELCHIKRGDLWLNLAQTLLQIVHFFNPLLWLANAIIRGLREKAVDEMVLTKLTSESDNYCTTLIDIAEIAFSRPHLALRLIGVVESKKALQDRIKHMLSRPFPKSAKLGWISITAVFILAAVLLPMAKGITQNKPVTIPTDNTNNSVATSNEAKALEPANTYNGCIATLPNGVTFELLGVCNLVNNRETWWAPSDAQKINNIEIPYMAFNPNLGDYSYAYIFITSGWEATDVHIDGKHTDGSGFSFAPKFDDEAETQLSPTQCLWAGYEQNKPTITFTVKLGVGNWHLAAEGPLPNHPEPGSSITHDEIFDRHVRHNGIKEIDGKLAVSVLHLIDNDYDCRIVASGKDGKIYYPTYTSNLDNDIRECLSYFVVPLASIEKFSIEARPQVFITFEDVSLRQGQKTDTKVSVRTITDKVQGWASDYIKNNMPDIILNKIISRSEVVIDDDWNHTIVIKYQAITNDKSTREIEQEFSFRPDGKFVSVKELNSEIIATTDNTNNSITDIIGSSWELTQISGNGADAYTSAKLYIESENMVRLEAIMVNGPATFYGSYNITNSIISITNTDNGFIMSGPITSDTMTLTSASGDLKTTMSKIQDWPAVNSAAALPELLGEWKMTEAKGKGADAYTSASLNFKTSNYVLLEGVTDGEYYAFEANYNFDSETGRLEIFDEKDKTTGYLEADKIELIIPDENLKITFKKDINTANAKTGVLATVKDFFRAVQTEDIAKLMNCIYIEDEQHREKLNALLKEYNPELNSIKAKSPEIVEVYPADNGTFYVLTLNNIQHDMYMPQGVLVVKSDTGYKIKKFSREELERMRMAKEMSSEDYGRMIFNEQKDKWLNADSQQLTGLYQDLITTSQRNLVAAKYAKEHNIKLAQWFSEEEINKQLEEYSSRTPKELRDLIIKETEQNENFPKPTNKAAKK